MKKRIEEYLSAAPPSLGPDSVGIVPSNACNLNCVSCWSYSALNAAKPPLSWQRQQLPFAIMSRLITDLAAMGTRRIILTGGGDPLVYPHYYDTLELAHAVNMKTTLISNLTLVRDNHRFLAHPPSTVLANFSCTDESGYVAFHPNQKPESFHRLMDLLLQLKQAGSQLKLVFVVCTINVEKVAQLIPLAAGLNASVQFKLMSATDATSSLVISENQRAELLNQLPAITHMAQTHNVEHNIPVLQRALQGVNARTFPIEQVGCYAGHWYSRVKPNGDIYFCCNTQPHFLAGNLHTASFPDIWNGSTYQQLRHQMRQKQFQPGCQQCGKFDLNMKVAQQIDHLIADATPSA
jgi:radical SAM protein with 4Fe4S-binding SPASM domain